MMVSGQRTAEKTEIKTCYYISSRQLDAIAMLKAKQEHWGIKNRLHWVLDMAFREDHCRVCKDHAPENFAIIRHMAINMLRQEKTVKAGIQAKRLKCGWDQDYLLAVLSG